MTNKSMVHKLYTITNEDIYFFEVYTKYISSTALKASELSLVCSTSETSDVFNSQDEIYLVFTGKKLSFFYFIFLIGYMQCLTHQERRC